MENKPALQSVNAWAKCKFYRPGRIFTSLMTFENYFYPGSKDVFLAACSKQSVSCVWDLDQNAGLSSLKLKLTDPSSDVPPYTI